MPTATHDGRSSTGLALDRTEARFPLDQSEAPPFPDLTDDRGPVPFAFRYLTPVTGSGGILPSNVEYDEESQTCTYDNLPPGVFMTKNPPMTYYTTEATAATPERTDAKDDPGSSDD